MENAMTRQELIDLCSNKEWFKYLKDNLYKKWSVIKGCENERDFEHYLNSCLNETVNTLRDNDSHSHVGTGGISIHWHKWDNDDFMIYVDLQGEWKSIS